MFNFCFFFKRISQIIFFPNINININLINVSSSFGEEILFYQRIIISRTNVVLTT